MFDPRPFSKPPFPLLDSCWTLHSHELPGDNSALASSRIPGRWPSPTRSQPFLTLVWSSNPRIFQRWEGVNGPILTIKKVCWYIIVIIIIIFFFIIISIGLNPIKATLNSTWVGWSTIKTIEVAQMALSLSTQSRGPLQIRHSKMVQDRHQSFVFHWSLCIYIKTCVV